MKYLPTAFANLFFAWKLYHYGLDGKIDVDDLDADITFQENGMIFVLPRRIFENYGDFINALQNNLTIAFGAAAITLKRSCEEAGLKEPNDIVSENDQCIALISQIRNAFSHDISEPRWEMRNPKYLRVYEFGGIRVDLTGLNGQLFAYEQIGGPDALILIKEYAETNLWPPSS